MESKAHIGNMNHVPELEIPLMNKITRHFHEVVGTPGPAHVRSLIEMVNCGTGGLLEGLDMHMQHKSNLELLLAGSYADTEDRENYSLQA